MAIPDNVLSTDAIPGPFLGGRALPVTKRTDYESGGVAFNDPSQGLMLQNWRCRISDDDTQILVDAENIDEENAIVTYEGVDITECSLTFDQNMRPQLAFVEGGEAKLRWYDTQAAQQVITNFGSTYITPRVSLDDKRMLQSGSSDVILAYMRDGNLYYRQQRDRYTVEYLLASSVPSRGIVKIGMNRQLRFQFLMAWQ